MTGRDGRSTWAEVRAEQDTIVVSVAAVPVQVQFACSANPPGQLYNGEGLPAR